MEDRSNQTYSSTDIIRERNCEFYLGLDLTTVVSFFNKMRVSVLNILSPYDGSDSLLTYQESFPIIFSNYGEW